MGCLCCFHPYFKDTHQEITTHLALLVGPFYGIINRPNLKSVELTLLADSNSSKEDVLRSILYFIQDGIVVRFNQIGLRTRYYGKSGGLGTFQERLKPMFEACQRLKTAYPEYGEVMTKRQEPPSSD